MSLKEGAKSPKCISPQVLFSCSFEGHQEMLASHKISYQFLLPCNPSAYFVHVCTLLIKRPSFLFNKEAYSE